MSTLRTPPHRHTPTAREGVGVSCVVHKSMQERLGGPSPPATMRLPIDRSNGASSDFILLW